MYVAAVLKMKHSLNRSLIISKDAWEEIKIPMPWGFISGKWRGPRDKRPILLLHGWKDNSGTFDRLTPRLHPDHGYLAIDFPGHGLSSHLPLGTSYYLMDHAITINRIVKYFNWSNVSIVGHSLGATIGYYYELLFPKKIDFLVAIDALQPLTSDIFLPALRKDINLLIKYENALSLSDETPSYTMEELKKKLYIGSQKSIGWDMCEYLLKRNIKKSRISSNKYYFITDLRAKLMPLLNIGNKQIIENMDKLVCPTLYFQSSQKLEMYSILADIEDFVEDLQKIKKNFERHVVDGTHHVHLNSPELLDGYINDFIARYHIEQKHDVAK